MGKSTPGPVITCTMTVSLLGCLSQQDQPLLALYPGSHGGAGGGHGVFLLLGEKCFFTALFPGL